MRHQRFQSTNLSTHILLIILMSPFVASLRVECPESVSECFYVSKMAMSFIDANKFCIGEGK